MILWPVQTEIQLSRDKLSDVLPSLESSDLKLWCLLSVDCQLLVLFLSDQLCPLHCTVDQHSYPFSQYFQPVVWLWTLPASAPSINPSSSFTLTLLLWGVRGKRAASTTHLLKLLYISVASTKLNIISTAITLTVIHFNINFKTILEIFHYAILSETFVYLFTSASIWKKEVVSQKAFNCRRMRRFPVDWLISTGLLQARLCFFLISGEFSNLYTLMFSG